MMGRKELYQKEWPKLVRKYAEQGLIESEMMKKLGVGHSSFNEYKKKYPEFLEALKEGKKDTDDKVEQALLKKALGYQFTECYEENEKEHTRTRHMPPDTTAIIFWLKNRRPDEWQDKRDHNLTGNITLNFDKEDEGL